MGSEERADDSQDLLEVFTGESDQGREELILEATSRTALRKGNWVMIPPYKGPAVNSLVNIELGNSDTYQLYNLEGDLGQQTNLAGTHGKILEEMIILFNEIRGESHGHIEKLELK